MKAVNSIVFLLLLSTTLYSQEKVKFGKVSMDEMLMTVYEKDSSAGAVILSDIGIFNSKSMSFNRHIRIKILKKSGLEWGNQVFNTPSQGDFRMMVYNLVDNEIVKEKAKSSSIHSEKVFNNYEVYKVFAPGVKEGSVIDIEYNHSGLPFEWRFQDRIPVLYSYLKLEESPYMEYSKMFFGFETIETLSPIEWEAHDLPAFKIEPFVTTYKNYITKYEFQLKSLGNDFTMLSYDISTSWEKVIENLLDFQIFGRVMRSSGFLNDFIKELKQKDLTTEERIKASYDYLQEQIKWNGVKTIFASEDIGKNFKINHSGNSADINLMLVYILDKLGIKTSPVVLSTRDNGIIIPYVPSLSKLNYVVAYVKHDNVEMLIDATDKNGSPGILPSYCLNGKGLIVERNSENWVDLYQGHPDQKKQFINIKFDDELNVLASISQSRSGYGFLDWADHVDGNDGDNEMLMEDLQIEYPTVDITNYEVVKLDKSHLSSNENIELDLTNQLIDVGNGYIFTPVALFEYPDNPFKAEERKYPIDMRCPKKFSTTIIVNIPNGFEVKSIPESVKFTSNKGDATFLYMSQANGNVVQFRIELEFKNYIYMETEYNELKDFFSAMIKKVGEPIEIEKTI